MKLIVSENTTGENRTKMTSKPRNRENRNRSTVLKRSVLNYLGSLNQFHGTNLVNLLIGERERERERERAREREREREKRERERGNNVRGNFVDSRDDMTKTDISADEHEGDTVCYRVNPKAITQIQYMYYQITI